ncbi:DUF4238 domain-containing protein [Kribbella sp. NPDC051770]|uniref:DUF4238 domain-containing protein n=1 Tax=Kribbella sp. NPDC051770 TaxID=3155413 RepID=UPI0034235F48
MSTSKRHHYVPRAYLERFGQDGKVAVRRRAATGLIVTNPINVALETGFYETIDESGAKSVEVEDWLSEEIDGNGAKAIEAVIVSDQLPAVGDGARDFLATYVAIQLTRTVDRREEAMFPATVERWLAGRTLTADLMAEFLESEHLGFKPKPAEVDGAFAFTSVQLDNGEVPTKTDAISLSLRLVHKLAGLLLRMSWRLEVARKPRFITSDSPVILWSPPSSKDRYQGYGLNDCDEVRFPLDPGHQIVLTRTPGPDTVLVEPARVRASNADVAASCHKFVVGHPTRSKPLTDVHLAPRKPTLRFNLGPGFQRLPDGSVERMEDVIHVWVPRRASID